MDARKVIKVGNSIAVTLPAGLGVAAGDTVAVTEIKGGRSFIITKLEEVHP